MIDLLKDKRHSFSDLLEIMEKLRGPDGCPWDREQTHASIRANTLEEAYELAEAIDRDSPELMCEELGDVLLQVVFHAQMAKEAGRFDIGHVIDGICDKLIVRHPHIFGDVKVSGSEDVLRNWERIKSETKGQKSKTAALESVSSALPALMRAEKLISRAEKGGYDFDAEEALPAGSGPGRELFAIAVRARRAGVDPELALLDYCRSFVGRFRQWELDGGQ